MAIKVLERDPITRKEYRYASNWRQAKFLEVGGGDNGLGLTKGDYRIARIFANGKVDLVDMRGKKHRVEPIKLDPTGKLNRRKHSNEKRTEVHTDARIRYTDRLNADGRAMITMFDKSLFRNSVCW